MFILNPQSGTPIYRQLMEQVRRMISSGQLQAGTELPSVRELAMTHAVNPMTISKAYSMLEAEGLLDRIRGKGMRISGNATLRENSGERLNRLKPAIDGLVMAANQLDLADQDVIQAVKQALLTQKKGHQQNDKENNDD